jgi:hypothetical protein
MPKILLYITAKITWVFTFYGTCSNDNRAHVHVGKKGIDKFCKIWLEPIVSLEKQGDLTDKQTKQVLSFAETQREKLLEQWRKFKAGEIIKTITIKK